MRGIVWGYTQVAAIDQLRQIIEDYEHFHIPATRTVINNHNAFVDFSNGDRWCAVAAKESARGHKCNISYIDIRIPKDIIDCIIRPCTMAYPYQAFHVYRPREDEEIETKLK